jgi:hypothetical protein
MFDLKQKNNSYHTYSVQFVFSLYHLSFNIINSQLISETAVYTRCIHLIILWRIDPLLDKDLETNNRSTAVATIDLCWKWCYATGCKAAATVGLKNMESGGVFYVVHAEEFS